MTVKQLPIVPPHVPAAGVAELIKHLPAIVRSDPVNFNSDTSVNLFEVPGNILISKLQVNIITAFEASGTSAAATGTITVPCDTGTFTVFDSNLTLLQTVTTDQYLPSTNTGMIKTPDSGGYVIFLQAPGTTTAGQLEVYMEYYSDVDKL
jgi:hypothetical protein